MQILSCKVDLCYVYSPEGLVALGNCSYCSEITVIREKDM